jgi:hypothetical protein
LGIGLAWLTDILRAMGSVQLRVVALVLGFSIVADADAGQYYGRAGTPFGTIAALMGWADMQTVRAGENVEIRVSSWFGKDPAALIRIVESKGSIRTELILWWPSLNIMPLPSYWPSGPDVHCDAPKEGPQTCVKVVAADLKQDWRSLLRDLRTVGKCEPEPKVDASGNRSPTPPLPTHTEHMQLQISDRGTFRSFSCGHTDGPAGPVVTRTLRLLRDIATQAGY